MSLINKRTFHLIGIDFIKKSSQIFGVSREKLSALSLFKMSCKIRCFAIVIGLVLISIFVTNNVQAQSKEIKNSLAQAEKAWKDGDVSKAKNIYEICYRTEPQNLTVLQGLASVYYYEQDYRKTYSILIEYVPLLENQIGILEGKPKLKGKEKKELDTYKSFLEDARTQLDFVKGMMPQDSQTVGTESVETQPTDIPTQEYQTGGDQGADKSITTQKSNVAAAPVAPISRDNEKEIDEKEYIVEKEKSVSHLFSASPEKLELAAGYKDLEPSFYFAGTNYSSVKNQFINDITEKVKGDINNHTYGELQNEDQVLQNLIDKYNNESYSRVKTLTDSLIYLTHSLNLFQSKLKDLESDIENAKNKQLYSDQVNSLIDKKKTEYDEKLSTSKGENKIVKYYSNTLLVIQDMSVTAPEKLITSAISFLNNVLDEFNGITSLNAFRFETLFDNSEMKSFVIIDGYLTHDELKGGILKKNIPERIYKFISKDQLICLNDSSIYITSGTRSFELSASAKEFINTLGLDDSAKILQKNQTVYNFYFNEKLELDKIVSIAGEQANLEMLNNKRTLLNDSINLFTKKLDSIKKAVDNQTYYFPVCIIASNTSSINDFYKKTGSEMFDLVMEQSAHLSSLSNSISYTKEALDDILFYWNDLNSPENSLLLSGYKLISWGKIKNGTNFYLKCLFELRKDNNIYDTPANTFPESTTEFE